MKKLIIPIFLASLLFSCGNDPIPKPKAHLRLDYPPASYKNIDVSLPFTFDKNIL